MLIRIGLMAFLLFLFSIAFAQKKLWRFVFTTQSGKVRGTLKEATDSSFVVKTKKGLRIVVFSEVNKFRFFRTDDETAESLIGAGSGAVAAGTAAALVLTKGRNDRGRAMAGVVGGIGGALIGTITGGLTGPVIHNLFSAKKVTMLHEPAFYRSLPNLLQPYMSK